MQRVQQRLLLPFAVFIQPFEHHFVRVKPQRFAQRQIARAPESAQRRQIVRRGAGHRLTLPLLRRAIAIGALLLKVEHLPRIDAAAAQLADDLFRHRAEILADHHTAVTVAFQRQDRQQVVHWIVDVGAVVRRLAIGYPPQAQHRHDMIDAQRAAARHIGAQHINKGLISARRHHMRVHRRQAPVLAQRSQNIGRRAYRCLQTVEIGIAPGFRAPFRHADGEIAIKPHRHAVPLANLPALVKLPVRQPLQPEPETHLVLIFTAELLHRFALRVAIFFRPRWPAPALSIFFQHGGVQRVIRRLAVEAFAARGYVRLEMTARGVLLIAGTELRPGQPQAVDFKLVHRAIVDPLGLARRLDAPLRLFIPPPALRLFALLEIRHALHVDIDHVHPAARRRAVRTGALRAGGIERMNRVKADKIAAAFGDLCQHLAQIAEIADAPVTRGSQRIELHAGAP